MKKIIAVILVLCLAIGLVACVKPATNTPTEPTSKQAEVTEPTKKPATAPANSAAPTDLPDPIDDSSSRFVKIQTATYSETLEKQESGVTTVKAFGSVVDLANAVPETSQKVYRVEGWVKITEDDIRNCRVGRCDGESEIWSTLIKNFTHNGYTVASDGVVVYGALGEERTPYIVKFSENGEVRWELKLENAEIVSIETVVENADGGFAVFSAGWVGDDQCICLNQISADGRVALFKTNKIGRNTIGAVARVGDGYWLQIGFDEFAVVRMDAAGNVVDSLSFGEENANYCINSMVEYNGSVYMSVNSSPKIVEKSYDSANGQEIFDLSILCEDIDAKAEKVWEASGAVHGHNPELENKSYDITDRIKNHYTAVLLVMDMESGSPLAYYYAKESFGGKLTINDNGNLCWEIKNIQEAYRTPLSCNYYWKGKYLVYQCVVNPTGVPVSVEKADNTIAW